MNTIRHKAKKSLGQNFLKSRGALFKIVEAAELSSADIVLEIGPGKGALTTLLLERSGRVVAVEKDRDLVAHLKEKFAKEIAEKKLILLEDDILEFNNYAVLTQSGEETPQYKIVANIPYNITGAILKKFLAEAPQPSQMVLLIQKEVADRIIARDGKESILSISVKAFGTPKKIGIVKAKDFSPAPKVDSAIIAIKDISRKQFTKRKEELFFTILRTGFAHKRKVLIKNLESIAPRPILEKIWQEKAFSLKTRAENFSLDAWLTLTTSIPTLLLSKK